MGMMVMKGLGGALAAAVACCVLAGTAESAVLVQSDFNDRPSLVKQSAGVIKETKNGNGWRSSKGGDSLESDGYLSVNVKEAGLNLAAGSLDFTLIRGNEDDYETLFQLIGADVANPLLSVSILWPAGDTLPGNSEIAFEGKMAPQTAMQTFVKARAGNTNYDYWTNRVSFPHKIAQGEKFRVTLTWGPSRADNNIYFNGVRIPARLSDHYDFDGLMKMTSKILVGSQSVGAPAGVDLGYANQMTSTILDFKILDTPTAVEPEPIAIASVSHDAFRAAGFSGKLVVGNTTHVEMIGTAGAVGSFDVARFADSFNRSIAIDWKGYGVYLEDKHFLSENEVDLHNVEEYQVFISETPFTQVVEGMVPEKILKIEEQSYLFENLKQDVPYYVGVFARMRGGLLRPVIAPVVNRPLVETAPGTYSGDFTVVELENYPKAVLVAHLARGNELVSSVAANATFTIDTAMRLQVAASPDVLKADEKEKAEVTVIVTDANGNPAPGRKVRFVLATTSQYTGVVGGGAFTEQVGGNMLESNWKTTDLFGKVSATYVAGFAAKTAIIVARDMAANSTGTAVVKTFIQTTAELELYAEKSAAMAAGYSITVTSSDEWLTADGKSRARITATVTLAGKPVEGHDVSFNVSAGTGTVSVSRATTAKDGTAHAVYTAGKKIGMVLVTATDTTAGISGSVQIELRSDAPAKIAISLDPSRLPADGRSKATLGVKVTDINDNPNDNTEIEYQIASGGGRLMRDKGLTDRRGEDSNDYTAGTSPGKVSIQITVRSMVPTVEELAKASDFALLPIAADFF